MDTTIKHAIPFAEGDDPANQLNEISQAQAQRIDDIIASDSQGALALRPVSTPESPGKPGRFYFATDNKVLYRDYGTGWTPITPETGTLEPWVWSAAGDGWLLCDHAGVTTDYPVLRDLLLAAGSPFGTTGGNPRVPPPGDVYVGRDPAQPEFDTIGERVGAKTVALTPAETAIRNHVHGDGSLATATLVQPRVGGTIAGAANDYHAQPNLIAVDGWDGGAARDVTGLTGNPTATPNGAAHSNIQPTTVVNYRIHI